VRRSTWLSVTAALLAAAFGTPVAARAAQVTFTLDPDRSSISLSGTALGQNLAAQGPGSLTTSFEGNLVVDLSQTQITFLPDTRIRARDSGSWEPGPEGDIGSAPANYGGRVSVLIVLNAVAAARNIEFTTTSEPLSVANGQFNSSGIVFTFAEDGQSVLDYLVTGLLSDFGQLPLTGLATNDVTSASSIVVEDGEQALTIPVDATYFFSLFDEGDVRLSLKGELVATRPAGEPEDPIADYLSEHFPGEDDPAIVGVEADPDGDGLPNFVEYAFDLDPDAADKDFAPLNAALNPGGDLILEYNRPRNRAGIVFLLEGSDDLTTWTALSVTQETTLLGDDRERVTVTIDADAGAPRFIRLTVERDS
jgi:hypothetical protein